jgi:hypothetical protein
MKPTPKAKLAQTRALWDVETTGGPEAPDAKGRGVADPAPRPDPAAPQTARREAPAVDPAVATFYGNGVPDPLSDDVDAIIARLYDDGFVLKTPFPNGWTITFWCKRCKTGVLDITQADDGAAIIDEDCPCGPPPWFADWKRRATWYWMPRPVKEQRPAEQERCYACGEANWWHSIYGLRICRTCHPPAHPDLEARPSENRGDPI